MDDGRERCRRVPRVRTEAFVSRRAGRRGADAANKGRRRTRSENDDAEDSGGHDDNDDDDDEVE